MKKDWKYYLGTALFFYSFIPMGVVAILPFLGLTLAQAGAFAVAFLASGEMAFFCAAALLGKEFVSSLKKKIKTWFKKPEKPKPISRTRHRLGVSLLAASCLPHYFTIVYLLFFSHKESDINFLAWTLVVGEAAFITGLFTMGDDFWEKLKSLFVWSQ